MPPIPESRDIAVASYPGFLISFGPFYLGPGDEMNFTIAIVAGDNVHRSPTAYQTMFTPENPTPFYNQLDFSELAENARWAKKVYDNPGVDTDRDGYAGEFEICDGDTVWTKGDGVPDFRAGTPPPAPFVRVIPSMGKLVIRWNGYFSENYVDPFSRIADYEGYRVYVGLDNRRTSLSLLASYDRQNFKQFEYTLLANGEYQWKNTKPPYLLDSLKIIFNDPDLDPFSYSRIRPLEYNGEYYYFEPVDHNMYDLSLQSGIHKVYPNATDPGMDSTLWVEDDITTEHGRPLPKFYEYEYIYDGILPTVEYYVAVTAFDFGFAGGNIAAQESNPLNSYQLAVAQLSADSVEVYDLDVYVYPNPYRVDADYREHGYENRGLNLIPNRARLIHFGNLPNVCDIYIYSIDGDLIRRLPHHYPEGGPTAMHETWDLITRNVQAVESGLFYWVVESATRTQIGKLVIIK